VIIDEKCNVLLNISAKPVNVLLDFYMQDLELLFGKNSHNAGGRFMHISAKHWLNPSGILSAQKN